MAAWGIQSNRWIEKTIDVTLNPKGYRADSRGLKGGSAAPPHGMTKELAGKMQKQARRKAFAKRFASLASEAAAGKDKIAVVLKYVALFLCAADWVGIIALRGFAADVATLLLLSLPAYGVGIFVHDAFAEPRVPGDTAQNG